MKERKKNAIVPVITFAAKTQVKEKEKENTRWVGEFFAIQT